MIQPSGECHNTSLMISQHWFRQWLGAVRQQAITWTRVDKICFTRSQRVNRCFHSPPGSLAASSWSRRSRAALWCWEPGRCLRWRRRLLDTLDVPRGSWDPWQGRAWKSPCTSGSLHPELKGNTSMCQSGFIQKEIWVWYFRPFPGLLLDILMVLQDHIHMNYFKLWYFWASVHTAIKYWIATSRNVLRPWDMGLDCSKIQQASPQQCWTYRTKPQWNLKENVLCKMPSIFFRPQSVRPWATGISWMHN